MRDLVRFHLLVMKNLGDHADWKYPLHRVVVAWCSFENLKV